jgi:hypothetical protein
MVENVNRRKLHREAFRARADKKRCSLNGAGLTAGLFFEKIWEKLFTAVKELTTIYTI